jgi:alcohol dehydrogenase YqhD (iron-dependent ADH family)
MPTKVFFGRGVNASVGGELSGDGISRALILYGGGSAKKTGVFDEVAGSLSAAGVKYFECGGVKPNPVISKAREAIEIIRRNAIGAVVAIGGGSVIDSAKGIAAGALYGGDPWDLYSRAAKVTGALPVYAVATVSATASEMNFTSVMTNEDTGVKVGLGDPALNPRKTFIDPSVQFSVPPKQVADGGIDAICHVLETYFDGTSGVELQMEYAEGLVRSLMRLIPALLERPDDYDARAQFAWATASALNGTTWAGHAGKGDFASHAMGHTLSALYDAVHGETLSIIMPNWMRYVRCENMYAFSRFARLVFGMEDKTDEDASIGGIERMSDFFASLGAPLRLRDIGVPEEAIPALADKVSSIAASIGVLKKLERPDVFEIYRAAY